MNATNTTPKIHLHKGDLPDGLVFPNIIAVDTETMGLRPSRDRLCLVQISGGDGDAHIVQLPPGQYDAPNLKALMADTGTLKLFHFARFDIAIIKAYLGIVCTPIYCTRTASKLVRTYTDRHGLRECLRDLLSVEISKHQQSSDWGADVMSEAQLAYAASDVLHLHALKDKMDAMLTREGRTHLAQACFDFLPTQAELDLGGWGDMDIFAHSSK